MTSSSIQADNNACIAPHGLRCAAWVVDLLILLTIPLFLPQPISYLLVLGIFVAYHTILIGLVQQTVGKALMGLKVVKAGTGKPGWLCVLGRTALGYLLIDLLGIGVLLALFNRNHRCLHDYVFGTLVVGIPNSRYTLGSMSRRLVEFAERQKSALAERKKTAAILGALWAFLIGLGQTLSKAVNFLGSGAASSVSPSVATVLSTKAAASIAIAATAATGIAVTQMPALRAAADWLTEPRYLLGQAPGFLPVDRNVLALYQFDTALKEQTIRDQSNNGRNARLLGGTITENDKGNGLHISPAAQTGIDWSEHASLLRHPYTVEMILMPRATSPWGKLFSFDDNQDSGWYYKSEGIQSYPNPVLRGGQVQANQWHYLAFVSIDASNMDVYFQGLRIGSTPSGFTAPARQAIFFRDDAATSRHEQIDAIIKVLRISNVARSANDISAVDQALRQ